jgi:Mg2+-importing ATPase
MGRDADGASSIEVLELGAINAQLETGLPSPLDDAILAARTPDLANVRKRAELPFDFMRRRVSVLVEDADGPRLVTKGAFHHVLPICSELPGGVLLDDGRRAQLEQLFASWGRRGVRVLAVAERRLADAPGFSRDDERDLVFRGFLTFLDPPKQGAREAIAALSRLGVSVKLISGDSELVARHVAELVGLRTERVLTGAHLDERHPEALSHRAELTDLFVEVDPIQKEHVPAARRPATVGLSATRNDAPAMHAADTSLSVESAVDVAREASDFVLLERDLDVIRRGIQEGRKTFANTLKYVLTTTSANLGNMVSMALASLVLPFLPLTAVQILLNNLLSDVPAIGLANDAVDPELVDRPRRWDMRFIARFMVEFGLLSSGFDLLTFAVLLFVFSAGQETFRTAWFVESLLTELAIALVVRTRRPFYASRPGALLLVSTCVLAVVTLLVPYIPGGHLVGFVPISPALLAVAASRCSTSAPKSSPEVVLSRRRVRVGAHARAT